MLVTNNELDVSLRNVVDKCKVTEPFFFPQFSAMYYLGIRANESIIKNRWEKVDNNIYKLTPLKKNNIRLFDVREIPEDFLNYINNARVIELTPSYSQLNYLFKIFFTYRSLFVGDKQSTLHLFRHNYVKKLIDKGFTNDEIMVDLGERTMGSTRAYIDSVFERK